MWVVPNNFVEEFKDYFDRGQFTYGAGLPSIRDKDIAAAVGEATPLFNPSLYPDDNTRNLMFMYLVAHFVVSDFNAAESGGIGSAGFQTSRSADSVSESVQIPEWITNDPTLSQLCTTYYGRKYVLMASQYVSAVVQVVGGGTLP